MKYFSIETVVNAYKGFQDCMTNKSWGYLALLKGCKDGIRPSVPYEVDLDIVSNFLEGIFNLSQTKRSYDSGRSLYVVFSNKWDRYFNDQGRYSPDIYDVIVWAYRRKSFDESITNEDIVSIFAKEFNIPSNIIANSFNTKTKKLTFTNSLYSESQLKNELGRIGVDISRNNIDAKKGGVVAAPGEISRGPFVQTLYAGLEITDYVIIMQSDYSLLYGDNLSRQSTNNKIQLKYTGFRPYITAIKSKPFLLLAGISGTGKSRIVRELARACWEEDSEEYNAQKPRNFEMVQVRPNWHDSSELIGYVSRVSGQTEYVAGDFLRFIARAWAEKDVPYFLCLDEMNLAPVEQYFAEYLSVVESRKNIGGVVVTDPIVPAAQMRGPGGVLIPNIWYSKLIDELLSDCPKDKELELKSQFTNDGICLPQNLIVVGTVNMDETTFSFSRKVLDRAMTIEMNEVNLKGGLRKRHEEIGRLGAAELIGTAVEGVDVFDTYHDVCKTTINYLQAVNDKLEGTPFKIAYRTRNEFLLYVVNNLPYKQENETQGYVIARALDEITSMKILSRIEGDETKVSREFLEELKKVIAEGLNHISGEEYSNKKDEEGKTYSVSLAKLEEMKGRLSSGYTSFWS